MIGVILDLNSVLNSQALGYLGAFTAAVFFGSNYVVTKKFPLGDGFAFQWFMSMGIMMVGYVCLILSGDPIWVYSGLLGGSLWAMGNALVPTAIRLVGLGISFLLWSIVSLLIGWCSGKFGLFGLQSEEVSLPLLNDLGPIFGIASMAVYVFIKPTLEDEIVNKDVMVDRKEINDSDRDEPRFGSSEFPSSFFSSSPQSFYSLYGRRMIGAGMALAAGGMYGFCLVPFQLWYQQQNPSDVNPLMFVISHYSGIFITSTIIFIGYAIVKRNKPEIFSISIIPAMISGGMWGIAQAAWLITNATLGFVIGYPIVVVGPMIINSLWAVLLFKEIRGKKNLGLLGFALSLNIMCVICTVISSIDFSKYTSSSS